MPVRAFRSVCGVLAAVLVVAMSFAIAQARASMPVRAQAPAEASLPDGPGRDVVQRVCTVCHGTDFITATERTVQVWRDTLDLMKGYGAEATDEEWTTVARYLIAQVAYLGVNKAAAEEIGLVFAVDEKVAQGVVAYRQTQGGFKTIDDLKKAPGLDPARIDAVKTRLTFE